jgi:hypothetical protein
MVKINILKIVTEVAEKGSKQFCKLRNCLDPLKKLFLFLCEAKDRKT